jgi:hypothetical protein
LFELVCIVSEKVLSLSVACLVVYEAGFMRLSLLAVFVVCLVVYGYVCLHACMQEVYLALLYLDLLSVLPFVLLSVLRFNRA